MKINEISGKMVKIGKTSLTVKDEQGKTRGIVKGIKAVSSFVLRDELDFKHKTGLGPSFLKKCVNDRGEWFYLYDMGHEERVLGLIERMSAKGYDYSDEQKTLDKMRNDRDLACSKIKVIDCYIL